MILNSVAIITRTKDRPLLLERAIESICSQTFEDWYLVIINDGGNQEVLNNILKKYSTIEKKIKLIHNNESMGMEKSSNIGIQSTDSKYILIHDDDDTLNPQFLEKTINFMESSIGKNYGGVTTKINRVIEEIIDEEIKIKQIHPWRENISTINIAEMAIQNIIVPISFLYRREIHEKIGFYNETLPVLGDWEFYLRVLSEYDVFLLNDYLAFYHHRISLKNGIYSNSIIGGSDKHQLYDTLIRNRFLREDIKKGNPGLGYLLNLMKIEEMAKNNRVITEAEEAKQRIIRQLRNNDISNVALYGTGGFAKALFSYLITNEIQVDKFIDSNENLWGKTLNNIEIISAKEAAKRGYNYIVIGSYSFMDEIYINIKNAFDNKEFCIYCA